MLRAITDGRQTPSGCPLTATLFAKVGNTSEEPAGAPGGAAAIKPGCKRGRHRSASSCIVVAWAGRPAAAHSMALAPLPPAPPDCAALAELHELGYEVAAHTVQHKRVGAQAVLPAKAFLG